MTPVAPVARRLTEELLADISGLHSAVISCTEPGVVAGLGELSELAASGRYGVVNLRCADGQSVSAGTLLAEITGSATELAAAGDALLGPLGFAGGIARRCRDAAQRCPDGLRIVCGGWKKLPSTLKPSLRDGLVAGGIAPRLVDGDFVYVDKNAVVLRGGLQPAVAAARRLDHGPVAVQVTCADDAIVAARAGAAIVMEDTGSLASLKHVDDALRANELREAVTLAFAGGIGLDDLHRVQHYGADIVDLGRAILDAPLWDVHIVVLQ